MVITQITYRRLKNLGNYESEACEMNCLIERDEDIGDAFDTLKTCVLESLELVNPSRPDGTEEF